MTKKLTALQLFSIIDGRLSTGMADVYDMISHITGESLQTHHLPVAMDYIKKCNPEWFSFLKNWIEVEIEELCPIKEKNKEQFLWIINYLKENNSSHDIPPLSEKEREGFADFMLENSLLLKGKDY